MLLSCSAFCLVCKPQLALPSISRLSSTRLDDDVFVPLIADDKWGLQKATIEEGSGPMPKKGDAIEMGYLGTIDGQGEDWSVDEVIECWLKSQQGLENLESVFRDYKIDGMRLLDTAFFTEEFVTKRLGVENKITAKKLVMAAKRLAQQQEDFPVGMKFDERTSSFTFGEKNLIRGMQLGLESMKVGELAKLLVRCDYAYGAEGLRRNAGEVLVPPFATLCFEVRLISCSEPNEPS